MKLKSHTTFLLKEFHYVVILVFLGLIFFVPEINFQSGIAQGDHGRDLYIVKETLFGAKPYQDYLWTYGPLMPYYYSLFYKLLGVCPQSIMIGSVFVKIVSGIFFFLSLACFVSPLVAFTGSIWFYILNPQFAHTYNHVGAISVLPLVAYCLFMYLKTYRIRYLYINLLCAIAIALIKVNIGISVFVASLVGIWVIHYVMKVPLSRKVRQYYIAAACFFFGSITVVYLYFLRGLSAEYLQQCFPYADKYNPHAHISLVHIAKSYFNTFLAYAKCNWKHGIFSIIAASSFVVTVYSLLRKQLPEEEIKRVAAAIIILLIASLFNLHEYIKSGVHYRSFWSRPFDLLLIFLCVGIACKRFPRAIRVLTVCALIFISGYVYQGRTNWKLYFIRNTKNQYFTFPQGRFYSQNRPEWFATVHKTVDFLDHELDDDESFIAIPYDVLYYYLLDKKSPIWTLHFFEYMHLTDKHQHQIINELEKQNINYVLLSNRAYSKEIGLGSFGKTHCRVLNRYIQNNFEQIAQFGEWKRHPGCMWNHGTRILRRKKVVRAQ